MAPSAPTPSLSTAKDTNSAIVAVLFLALKVLSERTVSLAAALFPLIGLSLGFYLWLQVLAEPSILQLVGLGLFAAFFLLMLLVRPRHG